MNRQIKKILDRDNEITNRIHSSLDTIPIKEYGRLMSERLSLHRRYKKLKNKLNPDILCAA